MVIKFETLLEPALTTCISALGAQTAEEHNESKKVQNAYL